MISRRVGMALGVGLALLMGMVTSPSAQTPKISIDVEDVPAEQGNVASLSVFVDNGPDSIQAFEMILTLTRPDIMFFLPDIEQTGTLSEGWQGAVQMSGEYSVHVILTAGPFGDPPPIPPNTAGVLFKVQAELYCGIPDTMQDRTVGVEIPPISVFFSDPHGTLIEPVDITGGSVTAGLRCPYQGDGDADGFVTALDLSRLIAVLFEGATDPQDDCCPTTRYDLDCDGFTTSLDLSVMVDHLFAGGAGPCSP